MPIGYIRPSENPYVPLNVEYIDRKLMETQKRQDAANALLAEQQAAGANIQTDDLEAKNQYLQEVKQNYGNLIKSTSGNLARNYSQVLETINSDKAHPFHQLAKIRNEEALKQQQAMMTLGTEARVLNDVFSMNLYDKKEGKWRNPTDLRANVIKASDYFNNTLKFTDDIKANIGSLGLSPSAVDGFLRTGSFASFTDKDIEKFVNAKGVVEAWKEINPTAMMQHIKNGKPTQDFGSDSEIKNYIKGVLQQKVHKEVRENFQANPFVDRDGGNCGTKTPKEAPVYFDQDNRVKGNTTYKSIGDYTTAIAAEKDPFKKRTLERELNFAKSNLIKGNKEFGKFAEEENKLKNVPTYKTTKNANVNIPTLVDEFLSPMNLQNIKLAAFTEKDRFEVLEENVRNSKAYKDLPEADKGKFMKDVTKYANNYKALTSKQGYGDYKKALDKVLTEGFEFAPQVIKSTNETFNAEGDRFTKRISFDNFNIRGGLNSEELEDVKTGSNSIKIGDKEYNSNDLKFNGLIIPEQSGFYGPTLVVDVGDTGKKLYLEAKEDTNMMVMHELEDGSQIATPRGMTELIGKLPRTVQQEYWNNYASYWNNKYGK